MARTFHYVLFYGVLINSKEKFSHIAQLNGLCDRRQAHGADSIWALAYEGGTIETEEVMAARNQGSNHLVIHTLDTNLLSPHRRPQARSIGEEGLRRRWRGGGAFPRRGEVGAVRREPVGVEVSHRAERTSGNTLGLRVLQGFGSRDDRRKTGGPRLTGLEIDDRNRYY